MSYQIHVESCFLNLGTVHTTVSRFLFQHRNLAVSLGMLFDHSFPSVVLMMMVMTMMVIVMKKNYNSSSLQCISHCKTWFVYNYLD